MVYLSKWLKIVHVNIDPLLDYLSKFDYFRIQMDFVILYGSTEWKINEWIVIIFCVQTCILP
jgi:hypothetical protein